MPASRAARHPRRRATARPTFRVDAPQAACQAAASLLDWRVSRCYGEAVSYTDCGDGESEREMREDLVTPTMARRLAQDGLVWDPQPGDWVTALGGAHLDEGLVGLWLAITTRDREGFITLADADGRWPQTRMALRDCLWLPNAGRLKVWLRARGYRVATGESAGRLLGGSGPLTVHVCRLTHDGDPAPVDGEGVNEADAVASALLRVLGADSADSRQPGW